MSNKRLWIRAQEAYRIYKEAHNRLVDLLLDGKADAYTVYEPEVNRLGKAYLKLLDTYVETLLPTTCIESGGLWDGYPETREPSLSGT